MKYENFFKAKEIVGKIDGLKSTLADLQSGNITLEINADGNYGHIMTIGAYKGRFEHDYSEIAGNFIDAIKEDLANKIAKLLKELETL